MNFLKFPLNHQDAGSVVEVTMSGVESDVMLLDPTNFSSFQRGRNFRYTGGHYKASPIRLAVPSSGSWTAVVVPGQRGTVRATVRVL